MKQFVLGLTVILATLTGKIYALTPTPTSTNTPTSTFTQTSTNSPSPTITPTWTNSPNLVKAFYAGDSHCQTCNYQSGLYNLTPVGSPIANPATPGPAQGDRSLGTGFSNGFSYFKAPASVVNAGSEGTIELEYYAYPHVSQPSNEMILLVSGVTSAGNLSIAYNYNSRNILLNYNGDASSGQSITSSSFGINKNAWNTIKVNYTSTGVSLIVNGVTTSSVTAWTNSQISGIYIGGSSPPLIYPSTSTNIIDAVMFSNDIYSSFPPPISTYSPTPTSSVTPTSSITLTVTNTPVVSATFTPTVTPTFTQSPTTTNTGTQTSTITKTSTGTLTFTITKTFTISSTPTASPTSTNSPTPTNTGTKTSTPTPTTIQTTIINEITYSIEEVQSYTADGTTNTKNITLSHKPLAIYKVYALDNTASPALITVFTNTISTKNDYTLCKDYCYAGGVGYDPNDQVVLFDDGAISSGHKMTLHISYIY